MFALGGGVGPDTWFGEVIGAGLEGVTAATDEPDPLPKSEGTINGRCV
jgi:hypothetical protein